MRSKTSIRSPEAAMRFVRALFSGARPRRVILALDDELRVQRAEVLTRGPPLSLINEAAFVLGVCLGAGCRWVVVVEGRRFEMDTDGDTRAFQELAHHLGAQLLDRIHVAPSSGVLWFSEARGSDWTGWGQPLYG
jgi:hypothetical protein